MDTLLCIGKEAAGGISEIETLQCSNDIGLR
jgi:hypothetical protein